MIEFLDAVAGLPEQLTAAHEAAAAGIDPAALPAAADIANVVVLGMGGSGIAGDVLAAVANNELPVPVAVLKQYRTPAFVGPRSLVFAVSSISAATSPLSSARPPVIITTPVVAPIDFSSFESRPAIDR